MRCDHCGAGNAANYVACQSCGRRRVIRPPGLAAPAVAPPARHSMAAPAPAAFGGVTTIQAPAQAPTPTVGAGGGRYAKDATRYLCAALQLDAALNARVLRGTLGEPLRAIASSPGVDLVTVLRYGIAATRRQAARNVTLVILAVLAVVAAAAADTSAPLLLLLPVAWLLAFWERYVTLYHVLARELRRENFDPAKAPLPPGDRLRRRLDEIAARDRGNVTVFPAYAPFIGFGSPVTEWSTVVNTAAPAPGRTVERFSVDALHRHVAADLERLGLPGVSVEDRLFVNGLDLLGEMDPALTRQILPDEMRAPLAQLDQRLLDDRRADGKGRCRPYLMVRITGWSGEVVLTLFLRFALLPDRDLLFIEASSALLPPVRQKYREADRLTSAPAPRQVARLLGQAATLAPGQLVGSVPYVLAMVAEPLGAWLKARRDARQIRLERSFNYGAVLAPRELAHENRFYRYFQRLDKEMYVKIAERRILDSIQDFMRRHGIDTSEFAESQTVLINNGLITSGNAKFEGPVAAGPMARVMSRIQRAEKK